MNSENTQTETELDQSKEDDPTLFEPIETILHTANVLDVFEKYNTTLERCAKKRRMHVKPRSHIDKYESTLEENNNTTITHHTTQNFIGDLRLKNILTLLNRIDERGYERSANQVRFHEAFLSASGRCIYKEQKLATTKIPCGIVASKLKNKRTFCSCSKLVYNQNY